MTVNKSKKGTTGEGLVFMSIINGKKFEGELPKDVYAIHSENKDGMTVTMADEATKGDADYEKVLVAFMFMNGYITEESYNERTKK